jgi:autotransporter-associated beta strand protein
MKSKFETRRHLFTAFIALTMGSGLSSVSAQSTWIGNTDAELATAANWDVAPVSGGAWVFGVAGTAGATLTNNLTTSSAFEVAGITFGTTASAYVIDTAHAGTFSLTGNIVTTSANDHTIGSTIAISGTRQINLNGSKNILLTGNLTGNGSLTQTAGGSGAKSITFSGDNSGFAGTFTQNNDGNNRTAFNSGSSGSAAAAWIFNRNVAGGVALNLGTTTINFGSLAGGAFIRNNNAGTTTIRTGALNTSTTFSGQINDNGNNNLALTKEGTGTLNLSGTSSYDGATTVNGGILDVTSTGTISNSAVTVNNSATFQIAGTAKTLGGLSVTGNGSAKISSVTTLTNGLSATGADATIDLINSAATNISVNGAAGMTLGGATSLDKAKLFLEVGGTADHFTVANNLVVGAGGAAITVTNLGIAAGQSIPLISYAAGSGDGFTLGTGTTVGALTLTNPNLSFGVTGSLEVTAAGVNLITSGAVAPADAYWSGAQGSLWSSTSGSNANFTTTAGGATFLNVLPASNTTVYFSNNSPSNLTNTLGAAFNLAGLVYRTGSAAVTTTGTNTLTLNSGGILVQSGNGGATLGMANLNLSESQTWENDSANPLTVSAVTVNCPSGTLTLKGTGGTRLGGTTFTTDFLEILGNLDVRGTAVTTNLADSTGDITNTGADTSFTSVISGANILSGLISDGGTGSLLQWIKSGTGSLTLSGNNSYGGGTTLAGGTLIAGNDNAFGSGTVSITNASAILDLNGTTISNPLVNGATGGTITNSSETLATVTSGFNLAGNTGYVISDATINGTGDIRWDGAINRTTTIGTLSKSGTNVLIINEDNGNPVIAGMNLRVTEGTVFIGQTNSSFTNLTLTGGTVKMDPNWQVATANSWAGTFGNEIFINGGTWDLNGTGTNGVNNRTKRVSGTGGLITNSSTDPSLLVLAARDNTNPSWAGNIQDGAGSVALRITNSGSGGLGTIMTFSGINTYSGDTQIFDNTLKAGSVTALSPNSNFTLSNNAASRIDLGDFNNTIGSLTGSPNSQVLLGSATLTTGAKDDASTTFEGVISGTGGLVKAGTGTFTLTGANTYTGDTTVSAGVLAVDGDALADTGKLVIGSGKVEPTGIETVDTLYFGAAQQASGTWGATGSGATHIDDTRFSGTGVVNVTNGPGGSAYDTWALAKGLTPGVNDGATQDPEKDGIENALEFVLGGNPLASDTSILPVLTVTATHFVFTFNRADESEAEVALTFEYGSNLTGWTPVAIGADNASSGSGVNITENDALADSIVITIPKDTNTKLFGRLKAVK